MQTYRTTHDEVRPFRGTASEHDPAEIEHDLRPDALHYLASDEHGTRGCLTAIPSQWMAFDAWRVYGLAHLDEDAARALIARVSEDACGEGGPYHLWCAAPIDTVHLFEDAGWERAPGANVGASVDRVIMVHGCRPTNLVI